jgi:hypothetical protein
MNIKDFLKITTPKHFFLVALIVFIILSTIHVSPILKNICNRGIFDWDQHFFFHEVPRETIVRYNQFPLWNPYYFGGNVLLANTQTRFLSPSFIFILLFGTIAGLKLEIWLHLILGMTGMYLLARKLGIDCMSSMLSAIIYMCSGTYAFHLTVGHTWFLSIAYLPYVVFFYLKSLENVKFAILSGAFIALMILEGGIYPAPMTSLFLVFFAAFLALKQRSFTAIKSLCIVAVFSFLFSAVKFIPAMEFFWDYPRFIESSDHISLYMLPNIFFKKTNDLFVSLPGQKYGWWEYSCYIGVIPVLLWLLGSIIDFKKRWPLIVTGVIFLTFALGDFGFLSPWHYLHKVPIFKSMHVPSRFTFVFLFTVALFTGFFLDKLKTLSMDRHLSRFHSLRWFIYLFLLVFVTVDIIVENSRVFASAFPHPHFDVVRNKDFKQIEGNNRNQYMTCLGNEGTLNGYDPTHFPVKAVAHTDPEYKGEVFVSTGEIAVIRYWSPNKIKVELDVKS